MRLLQSTKHAGRAAVSGPLRADRACVLAPSSLRSLWRDGSDSCRSPRPSPPLGVGQTPQKHKRTAIAVCLKLRTASVYICEGKVRC